MWWMSKLHKEGVALVVIGYSGMIIAYTRRGDAMASEEGLARMSEEDVVDNVVSFSSVISACARRATRRPPRGGSRR